MRLEITSSAFDSGDSIPMEYTCQGKNVSPPLSWRGVPEGTESLVLICDDPDASSDPGGPFSHWVLYDLPPDMREISEGFSSASESPQVGTEGRNSFGNVRYDGPCPPRGAPHQYVFRLFALEKDPGLQPGATRLQVLDNIEEHILDRAEYIGQFAASS